MPKYEKREYQVGDYWLSQRENSRAWYRMWFDPDTRQTRRASLGTTDFQEAKQKLNEWFVLNQRPQNAGTDRITLAQTLHTYWHDHGQHIASAESARISCQYWTEYFRDATIAEITPLRVQEGFHRWLAGKGLSPGTVSRVLSVGRAAINRAWKNGEIASVPFIGDVSRDGADPRGRPLNMDEMSALLTVMETRHLLKFALLMIGTVARPDAVRDLTKAQCDFEHGLIHLNPPGRKQTKKHRPTVKMPQTLRPVLEGSDDGHLIQYHGQHVDSIKGAWRRARARAGLDDQVNPYSVRHTMARWLRKEGVPAWEVSAQLGHKQPGMSTTEIYAPFDPAYLSNAMRAIDAYFDALRANCVPVNRLLIGKTLAE